VRHHLVVAVHVRRAEVDEDVHDERYVHWKARNRPWAAVSCEVKETSLIRKKTE
jgi:hypothetical protein